MEQYFMIDQDEDGINVLSFSKKLLLERLNELSEDGIKPQYLNNIPKQCDGYFQDVSADSMIIIKGEIVCPKEITTVTEYDID